MYHLSVKTISRASGRSATAAAAYRSGSEISDERTGEIHDYTRKGGVEYSEIFLPENAPEWANDRNELWNAAEQAETRKNSTVAREFEIAIPKDLSPEQGKELVRDFTQQLVEKHGFAAEASIHQDHEQNWKGENKHFDGYHAHILCSTRRLEPEGFTEKTRELDGGQSGRENVEHWREKWADTANEHLQEAGHDTRIDHRSLQDQGIDRDPTQHLGPEATAMERRGETTEIGDANRRIEEAYERGLAERAELAKENTQIIDTTTSLTQALQEREQYQHTLDTLNEGADRFIARFEDTYEQGLYQEADDHTQETDPPDPEKSHAPPTHEPESFESWFQAMEIERQLNAAAEEALEKEKEREYSQSFSQEQEPGHSSQDLKDIFREEIENAAKPHELSEADREYFRSLNEPKEPANSKSYGNFEDWVKAMEEERKNNEKESSLDKDDHDHKKGHDYDNGR